MQLLHQIEILGRFSSISQLFLVVGHLDTFLHIFFGSGRSYKMETLNKLIYEEYINLSDPEPEWGGATGIAHSVKAKRVITNIGSLICQRPCSIVFYMSMASSEIWVASSVHKPNEFNMGPNAGNTPCHQILPY